jgi:hypothetical protein
MLADKPERSWGDVVGDEKERRNFTTERFLAENMKKCTSFGVV